jgi:hypothetical protein
LELRDDASGGYVAVEIPIVVPPSRPPRPVVDNVDIKFASTPAGANVRIAGTARVLGTTPCIVSFPRAQRSVTFELEKPGYEVVGQDIALAANGAFAAALAAKPIAAPAAVHHEPTKPSKPRPHPKALDRGGTMDVFGNR